MKKSDLKTKLIYSYDIQIDKLKSDFESTNEVSKKANIQNRINFFLDKKQIAIDKNFDVDEFIGCLTITTGNYKGGVGKTANTILLAYSLAELGFKVLVVDLDPQSNSTKTLMLTKDKVSPDSSLTINKTIMKGIEDGDLTDLPVKIMDNLYLLPSYIDFTGFTKFLYKNTETEDEENTYLEKLFKPFKEEYDFMFIDTPPMSIEISNNAVNMSDLVLISLQTQESSLTGAEAFIKQLIKMKQTYNPKLEVLGILPVLLNSDASVDKYILSEAKNMWGEYVFESVVPQMERIKRFYINGITNNDRHDQRVLDKYKEITSEFLEKTIDLV